MDQNLRTGCGIEGHMMGNLRRAVVWASAGQYLVIAVNLASVLVLARLMTPAEYGVSLLGGAILAVAEAIREVAGSGYLVRERELTVAKVRATTTLSALVTIVVLLLLVVAAEPLAAFFGQPALSAYLGIAVLGYAIGPFIHPQMALFGRELAFGRLALINLLLALVGASTAVLLALLGFGALSFAWAGVASAAAGAIACLLAGADASIYRPSLVHWRSVIGFGAYSSATAILGRIGEALPIFICSRFLGADAIAIGQRAAVLSLIPERVVLAAVSPVALPEFSRRAREGKDLKAAYLGALSHVSVVQWPAMVLLAVLAEPVVLLVLGGQWLEVAPLLRILCPALMLTVPIGLQYAILVASGALHRLPKLLLAQTLVMAAALLLSARHGLHALAWSMYAAMPVVAGLSLVVVQRAVGFRWRNLWSDAGRSALVTVAAAAGPLAVSLSASPAPISLACAALASMLGAAGWSLGLCASSHPFWSEVRRTAAAILPASRHLRAGR
jgi:O-antigen/teichoic acid export membrane protein